MEIIGEKISIDKLKDIAKSNYGEIVKAVVDIQLEIMAIDAELHADQESLLLEKGSKQEDIWGINIYPFKSKEDMIEFDSMINLRPWQENFSRSVEDPNIRRQIISILNNLIIELNCEI